MEVNGNCKGNLYNEHNTQILARGSNYIDKSNTAEGLHTFKGIPRRKL